MRSCYAYCMIRLLNTVIVSGHSVFAASLSSAFSQEGGYIPVLEGPRLARPDADSELIRLGNVLHRLGPDLIIYADQPTEASEGLTRFTKAKSIHVNTAQEIKSLGLGLRVEPDVPSKDAASLLYEACPISKGATKAVVYERNCEVSSVVAANYAVAHGADLYSLDIPVGFEDKCRDDLNTIGDTKPEYKDIRLVGINSLKDELLRLIPDGLLGGSYEKIMFVTNDIPYSIVIKNAAVVYAHTVNLGYHVANNLSTHAGGAKRKNSPVGIFAGNDKVGKIKKESGAMHASFMKVGGLVKDINLFDTRFSELYLSTFPYDVVYIATHGTQVKGRKNSYEARDDNGNEHELTLEFAEGSGGAAICLHSVDGVARDSDGWTKDHASVWGKFVEKYIETKSLPDPLTSSPTKIRMRQIMLGNGEDGLMSPIGFDRLASGCRPLVIVNACGSWSDLSSRFIYAGATAFVGTLWPITNSVATKFSEEFFKRLFDIELLSAFNQAKAGMNEDVDQMAYAISGTFESTHDPGGGYDKGVIPVLIERLEWLIGMKGESIAKAEVNGEDEDMLERIKAEEFFLAHELAEFNGALESARRLP